MRLQRFRNLTGFEPFGIPYIKLSIGGLIFSLCVLSLFSVLFSTLLHGKVVGSVNIMVAKRILYLWAIESLYLSARPILWLGRLPRSICIIALLSATSIIHIGSLPLTIIKLSEQLLGRSIVSGLAKGQHIYLCQAHRVYYDNSYDTQYPKLVIYYYYSANCYFSSES